MPSAPPLVLVAFLFPAFAGFNFGFDIGSTSGAVTSLRALSPALDASPLLQGLMTSGSLFGSVIGVAISFCIGDPFGRRGELCCASLCYLLGTAITITPQQTHQEYIYLLPWVFTGRVVYGVGIALAMHAACARAPRTKAPRLASAPPPALSLSLCGWSRKQ